MLDSLEPRNADLPFRVIWFHEQLTRGNAVYIQPAGIERRPICAIAATVDEVRIELPTTRATIATWQIDHIGLPKDVAKP